jgi:hypothetical protein
MIDYSKLPFFEEVERECDDGVVRVGAFIPYEENNVYRSDKGVFQAIEAVPCHSGFRSSSLDRLKQTHALHPYWTMEHRKRMEELGFERKANWVGNMSAIGRGVRR